jgi:hypothetical protein
VFGGILDKVTGFLDQRLVLTSVLPSIAFWAVALALAGSQFGWKRAERDWSGLGAGMHVLLTVVAVALLILFALVLSAHEGLMLSLYEGYWGSTGPGRWLARRSAQRHQKRVAGPAPLDKQQYEFRYRNYPRRSEDIMPTRLGNILKAAEAYPGDKRRYGMDAVFFWPRLLAVVPDSTRADLSDARASMAMLLNVCTLSFALAVGSLIALAVLDIRVATAFWAVGAGGLLLSFLAYRSALGPAGVYADLVRSSFDLYKADLLTKLGFALPANLADERQLWTDLGQLLYRRSASHPGLLDAARQAAIAPPDAP